jgi:hypothetical protein
MGSKKKILNGFPKMPKTVNPKTISGSLFIFSCRELLIIHIVSSGRNSSYLQKSEPHILQLNIILNMPNLDLVRTVNA